MGAQGKTKMEYKRGREGAYHIKGQPMKREEKNTSFQQNNQVLKSSKNGFS